MFPAKCMYCCYGNVPVMADVQALWEHGDMMLGFAAASIECEYLTTDTPDSVSTFIADISSYNPLMTSTTVDWVHVAASLAAFNKRSKINTKYDHSRIHQSQQNK